jgi:hypothetical protein
LGGAFGLEALQFGEILFALTPEAAFLNGEVVELALIGEEDLGVGEEAAGSSTQARCSR